MPHAIALHRKYADKGLKVVLVHCQEFGDLPAFMLRRFPGCRAMVTADNPVTIGTTGNFKLPRAALVGCDGTVLADGHRSEVGARIDELIPEQLALMKKGWGAHPHLAKARALLYGKGDVAGALERLDGFQPAEAETADLAALRREIDTRAKRRLGAVEYWLKAGRWTEARTEVRALKKDLKGVEAYAASLGAVLERLGGSAARGELARCRKIDRLMQAVRRKGPDEKHRQALSKLAEGAQNSPTAARARRLAHRVARALLL